MDSPGADCKFMGGVHRLTGLDVYPNPNMIEILDDSLFKFPYAYIVGTWRNGSHDKEEAARLREYLLRGGFIHADDFWGLEEKANFEYQMKEGLSGIFLRSAVLFATRFSIRSSTSTRSSRSRESVPVATVVRRMSDMTTEKHGSMVCETTKAD